MLNRMRKSRFLKAQFAAMLLYFFCSPVIASSDDNYNFYIQKAPGPLVVNQGTKGNSDEKSSALKAPVTKPEAEAATTTAAAPEVEAEAEAANGTDIKRWALGLNYGYLRDVLRYEGQSALGFDISYSVNRFLAFGGGMLFAHNIKEKYNRDLYRNSDNGNYERIRSNEWYAQALVTPFHLDLFDREFLDIGGVAGVMSTYKKNDSNLFNSPAPKRATELYFGPTIALNFTPAVALRSEIHFHQGKNYQAIGGLRVRF